MATARSIPTGYQREIERAQSQEHVLVFMTFDADTLATPIRVVNDPKDHTYGGDTYTGFMFDIEILSDTDQPPRAQVSVQNVDRQIGEALRQTTDPIRCTITICPGSEFDQTVDPRTEIGTAAVVYQATDLYLVDVEVDAMYVRGVLMLWDYSQEQWPSVMATQDRMPGLFR